MSDPYLETIRNMGRDVYERMLEALATGRWPDGQSVSAEQRAHAMRAVIAWGEVHLPPQERVGFIDAGHKADNARDGNTILKWKDDSR